MAIETKLVTAEELFWMPSENAHVELVAGRIERSPLSSALHGRVASDVGISISEHVHRLGLGTTVAGNTGFILRRNPDTVRAPDFAFVRKERWSDGEEYFPGAPDLAVEVIEPYETYMDVDAKVLDWLECGVRLLIVINLGTQSAIIRRSLTRSTRVDIDGALDAGDVIPGWTLPLRDLFVS